MECHWHLQIWDVLLSVFLLAYIVCRSILHIVGTVPSFLVNVFFLLCTLAPQWGPRDLFYTYWHFNRHYYKHNALKLQPNCQAFFGNIFVSTFFKWRDPISSWHFIFAWDYEVQSYLHGGGGAGWDLWDGGHVLEVLDGEGEVEHSGARQLPTGPTGISLYN